jgi:RNA ligase
MTLTAATGPMLRDILDPALLEAMLAQGFVRTQTHPTRSLAIYNYTEACQWAGVWNEATLACRGLVVDSGSGVVLARPFAKFFNHGQPGAPGLDLTEPVTVSDKADGSLGILYPDGAGWAVATRGSFASDQARHASDLLATRYAGFTPPPGLTVLVEIIYPANRIVLDYRGLDDLVLLGAVDIATGVSAGPAAVPTWPGPVVETLPFVTFGAALAAPPRPNREGLVVHVPSSDVRVKIKYEEYVRLHRIVTGLNARTVWEHLAGGGELADLMAGIPDEFHGFVRDVAATLVAAVEAAATDIEAEYQSIVDSLPEGWTRKDFALRAASRPERAGLFLRLDTRDYRPLLWQRVRPDPTWSPRRIDPDAA